MITVQSDPLMYFNTFLLLAFDLKSTAKPGGAMLPLAPPLLPRSKTRGCTAPPCSPPHWRPCNQEVPQTLTPSYSDSYIL